MSVDSQSYFIDSNIWLYRFIVNPNDLNSIKKQQIAIEITSKDNLFISTQVINEVCFNLIKKAKFNDFQIDNLIKEFNLGCEILSLDFLTVEYAVKLRKNYCLSFWDSLIVASAILGNVNIIYSEDMQNNLIIENKVTIINPFNYS
ncbi:PIN domain-containing protein [Geminocystis sp. CENA526]|uniref:PIN domain-containing protein n=1 Tax=Geminocystis sp. CENA526 TaxID=1355871 RepID=UPI003D6F9413